MLPDPDTLEGMPIYPNGAPRKLLSQSPVQTLPMKVSWFSTADSFETVMSFYEDTFKRAGVATIAHRYSPRLGYVAWRQAVVQLDGGRAPDVMHMVSVVHEREQTLVFLSISRPEMMLQAASPGPDGFIAPPDSSRPQVLSLGESVDHVLTHVVVRKRTVTEVRDFYRAALAQSGWQVEALPDETGAGTSLSARRGHRHQRIALSERAGEVDVFVTSELEAAP
ncbi:MAG: hypothetical protein JNG84_02470 [Archangium sp.]|nr:hypothetical protein [Archangium sp.]